MRENNIKPAEAAEILGVSPQFIRVAMQMGQLPIGIAIKLPGSSEYTYIKNMTADTWQKRRCSERFTICYSASGASSETAGGYKNFLFLFKSPEFKLI